MCFLISNSKNMVLGPFLWTTLTQEISTRRIKPDLCGDASIEQVALLEAESPLRVVDYGVVKRYSRCNRINLVLGSRVCFVNNFRLDRAGSVPRIPSPVEIRHCTCPFKLSSQGLSDEDTLRRPFNERISASRCVEITADILESFVTSLISRRSVGTWCDLQTLGAFVFRHRH